jgi:para-aminobenzoate synthetase/4-amino-4-deoxychorismate lyase
MPVTSPPRAAARAVRVALEGDVPAARAALLVRDDPSPFALVGRWAGGGAIAGGAPARVAGDREDPFALLDRLPPVDGAGRGFVGGGWFGFLGYRLGARLERLAPAPPTRERLPPAALAFHDHVLRCDAEGRWWFEALWTDARAAELERRLEELRARVRAGVPAPGGAELTGAWRAEPTPDGHGRAVAACRERIAAGDLFQANLSLRLRAGLRGDPAELFTRGVAALAPDRAAFAAGPWGAIASLSPELFVERHGDVVRCAPIKGTRPRPDDAADAERRRAELAASAKDRAENVMIVDLVRNDLGRVCAHGTVRVTALAEVRPHAGVWHLVSEVEGRRRAGVGDGELVAAMFPPGSVTGAPKLAAMDVISELESAEREVFTGALGFASPAAGLELSVAIRTFEARDGRVWLDVGGGVVADSDPAAEAAECLAKARPLLAAIGAALPDDAGGGAAAAPGPARLGPRPVPRPDPSAGVFETILAAGGRAVALDRHLERLRASAAALGLGPLPGDVAARVRAAAAEAGDARVRVLAGADGFRVQTAELPAATGPVGLRAVCVPGGLGAHKWRDRRLLDALAHAVAPDVPLLVDLDGLVLETSRAGVVAVRSSGELVTPPLDGRILPGVTRARLLETAAALGTPVTERPLALEELAAAREVLLAGALRLVEPVAAIDGAALPDVDVRARTFGERIAQMR